MSRRKSGTMGAMLRAVGGILDLGATQRCYVQHERRYVPSATIHDDMLRDWTAVGDESLYRRACAPGPGREHAGG
jgi:hypothetical protein